MLLQIGVFIIGISFLIFAVFAIPTLLQLRKTVKRLETTTTTLNENLPNILTSLNEISTSLSSTSVVFKQKVEVLSGEFDKMVKVVDETIDMGQDLRNKIEPSLLETVDTLTAIIKGVNAFLRVIRSK